MSTYLEEKKIKDAARKFSYQPVLFDRMNPPAGRELQPGDLVVKIQPNGTLPNGTMGMTYVGDPVTGEFIGLVMLASLVPAGKAKRQAPATAAWIETPTACYLTGDTGPEKKKKIL